MIIKIPFRGLDRTEGTEDAPDKILEALKEIWLSEEGKKPYFDSEEVKVYLSDIDKSLANIEKESENLLKKARERNDRTIFLGGDHSISYATVKAFLKQNPGAGLIIFDSHADLMPTLPSPVHEDWLRSLIEQKILDPSRLRIVGLQNIDEEEKKFADLHKIKTISAKQIFAEGIQEICDSLMETARAWPALYISVDIDVVDPAHAPAVAYPEPGGLSSRELLYFLQRLALLKNFTVADIVEIIPKKDVNGITTKLGAKILSELL
ncbi:MAG TPA: arginase family protein [Nanoarchaeota archaeon]|nr:MAG: agmatinase [archaeon GW2011_AR6]MBS3082535.1 arginase family protein [Candidatus Pacearchaeota archaeon]HIH17360.1 arginase family protein [Nanoarchaeota archaeon]HIH33913.1 arginase family protein [Nanoarchaeota archaeon]HIH51118.1 arginase family protein [Nanoarchaeota archaeon]